SAKKGLILTLPFPTFGMSVSEKPSVPDGSVAPVSEGSTTENMPDALKKPEREKWGSKWSFILCCIGYSVGLGNVWRFPKLAYENGGLAFLLPYWISAMIFGLPGLFFEYLIGQWTQSCAPQAFRKMAPLFQGLGWTMCVTALIISLYYNVIVAWVLLYIMEVFKIPVSGNVHNILDLTGSIDDAGGFSVSILIALGVVWALTCLAIMFGAKIMGYTAYFTGTVPYVLIGIIFVRGVTLDGAYEGVYFYILDPKWEKLLNMKTWAEAISQCCFSLSLGLAGLLNMASYNDRKHNSFRDALILVFADSFMSVFGGIGVFAILGFVAKSTGKSVDQVVAGGMGLAFIAYPEAASLMPMGWVFALVFFLMLFIIGIGTQFVLVSALPSAIVDAFPNFMGGKGKMNGMYWLDVMDTFGGSVVIPLSSAIAVIMTCYIYGLRNFLDDIGEMFGERRNWFSTYLIGTRSYYFTICWLVTVPILGHFVFGYKILDIFERIFAPKPEYPTWAYCFGIAIILFQFSPFIFFAIRNIIKASEKGEPIRSLLRVQPDHPSYKRIMALNAAQTPAGESQIESPSGVEKADKSTNVNLSQKSASKSGSGDPCTFTSTRFNDCTACCQKNFPRQFWGSMRTSFTQLRGQSACTCCSTSFCRG
ncbi:unnamed protein product, partial [Mesorhabditis spiculigera]